MTQEASVTDAPKEAAAPAAADLGDLSNEQVQLTPEQLANPEQALADIAAQENTTVTDDSHVQLSEINTDDMDDAAFQLFMDSQLGDAPNEPTQNANTDEKAQNTDDATGEPAEVIVEKVEDPTVEGGYKFRIGGQDIEVSDPADIQRLIERGLHSAADAKAAMPAQKLAQMLANNKLTDPAQINRLIDIANGDEGALKQLLKEKDIDPYSLAIAEGDEDAGDYKPTDHSVTEKTVKLNKELDSLQDSEHFSKTADIVMEQWDEVSRQVFMDKPENFTTLNNQVADGTFDAISGEIQKLDMMGKLPTDGTQFEIYRMVGDQMFEKKMLPGQTPVAPESTPAAENSPEQLTAIQRLQQAADTQRRKRAVAPNRSVPQTQTQKQSAISQQEIYSSSDEEFLAKTQHLFKSM
jgi:hypothetical protein